MNRREFLTAALACGAVYTIPSALALPEAKVITPVEPWLQDPGLWQILDDPTPCDTVESLRDWLQKRYQCWAPVKEFYEDEYTNLPSFGRVGSVNYQHKVLRYGAVDKEFLPLLCSTVKADFSDSYGAGERIFFRFSEYVRVSKGYVRVLNGVEDNHIALLCRYSVLTPMGSIKSSMSP